MRRIKIVFMFCVVLLVAGLMVHFSVLAADGGKPTPNPWVVADGGRPVPNPWLVADPEASLPIHGWLLLLRKNTTRLKGKMNCIFPFSRASI